IARERRRECKPGRATEYVNPFAGLLRHARDGDTYYCTTRINWNGEKARVLQNTRSAEGKATLYSFPYPTFERAILARLDEVNPDDVLPQDDDKGIVNSLEAELERVRASIAGMKRSIKTKGFSDALDESIREQEETERHLTEQLRQAQRKIAHPLSDAWKD